ncbi:ATP-grasp fold amidoligase family protein [Aeromonas veronii]
MYLIRDFLRFILGSKLYTYIRFFITHRYLLNINEPQTFSEKIIHRKFRVDPVKFSKFVDKFTVRDVVRERIGEMYLVPLYFCNSSISINDFKNLPNQFVMKSSHGGGGNNVLVVDEKNDLLLDKVVSRFNGYLDIKLGSKVDELFYDIEKPSILVEKMLSNADGTPLLDYKFHRFGNNGDPFYLLQINSEYNTARCTKTLYDVNGIKSEIQFAGYNYGPEKIQLPDRFSEMIILVDKLAKGFEYVRVDLFNVEGMIYFGEMTFCPASGWDKLNTKENDIKLGQLWK